MKSRDRVLRALEREDVDILPYWGGFSSVEAQARFLGERYEEARDLEKTIFLARFFASDIVCTPTVGFPGGVGIFEQTLYEGLDHVIARTPYGGLLYWRKRPYFTLPLYSPVRSEDDLESLEQPSPETFRPRIRALAEKLGRLRSLDYFVMTEIKGPFEAPWMFLRGLASFLADVVSKPGFARRLVELAFKPILELTEEVVEQAPVDGVWMTEDLGENRNPYFGVERYRELFKPWHREVVRRLHAKGVKVFLHSHGNIMPFFGDLVEAGFDSIDPLDPADNMRLDELKERHGDRVTLMGGLTKNVGVMTKEEIRRHVEAVAKAGGRRGFILMNAGGVPPEMPLESFNYYSHLIEKVRRFESP